MLHVTINESLSSKTYKETEIPPGWYFGTIRGFSERKLFYVFMVGAMKMVHVFHPGNSVYTPEGFVSLICLAADPEVLDRITAKQVVDISISATLR